MLVCLDAHFISLLSLMPEAGPLPMRVCARECACASRAWPFRVSICPAPWGTPSATLRRNPLAGRASRDKSKGIRIEHRRRLLLFSGCFRHFLRGSSSQG